MAILTRVGHEVRRRLSVLGNPARVAALQRRRALRLHLGCGSDRLPGFVNIDVRATAATDVVMNLTLPRLANGSVALAFSNAFFEHLYRLSRAPHLRRVREALTDEGVCCYIGIPYFRNIARLYIERGPGTAGPLFDLYNVYRYTHGDPEHQPAWWLGQLHKSLFDEEEIAALLDESGFRSYVVFCYGYPGDTHEVRVTMGFYATREPGAQPELQQRCRAFLEQFADTRIRLQTLEWLTVPEA